MEAKSKKLKKLWNRYEQVRAEVQHVQRENQQQKEDLLQTIRENDKDIKLLNFIIGEFVPEEERGKIEEHCDWDDVQNEWFVQFQDKTGAVVRQNQQQGNLQNSRGSPIAGGGGGEDDDLNGMSVSGIPNVYFAYPSSSGGPIEQAVEEDNPRPTSSRPKSRSARPSSKRPSSARKSSRAQEEASKLKSQFLSFDEAQQLEMQVCSEARQSQRPFPANMPEPLVSNHPH